jgi:hypothetical protein
MEEKEKKDYPDEGYPVWAEAKPAEPVAWAISYDGKTPYALWDYGDGALLDLEVKRLGGTASKMPLYVAPAAPADDREERPDFLAFNPAYHQIAKRFAALHAAPAAPAPEPLHEHRIDKLWRSLGPEARLLDFARAIERAHRIGIAASKESGNGQ